MDKPTKALILGVVVGALLAGVGLTNSHRLERRVQELQARCVAEREKEVKTPAGSSAGDVFDFLLLCDPIELGSSNGELVGTQEELAAAQRELWQWNRQWKRWPISGGLAITVFFALPWAWYFLLRRIRELRQALIGK